jgi:arylsulfatase A-like enzyme
MSKKPNILLVAVDTLRADHLGCYGYRHPTSPRIDALASEGTLGERLFCPGIPTHPSFTTLYTGQHPIRHGIVSHGGKAQLPRETPTLPEVLLQAGYTTCAVDNLWRARSWFGRGYEFYVDPSIRRGLLLNVTCEEMNSRAVPWLRSHRDEPFFLFIHYWDPHYPLDPPAKYRDLFYRGDPFDKSNRSLEKWWDHPMGQMARDTWLRRPQGRITDADYVVAMYDQEIRYLDDGVAALLGTLDELKLAEDTLVVLLADHGTSLTEQGIFFEHHGLYDCTIHVPLIFRWPGHVPRGGRLPSMLQMSDVAPTILEAAGVPVPEEMEGVSAWKQVSGQQAGGGHDQVVSVECTWQAKWSLRTERHKLIVSRDAGVRGGPPRELYDLLADPREERNLYEALPDVARPLEEELESWIARRLRELGRKEDPLREQGISLRHLAAGAGAAR